MKIFRLLELLEERKANDSNKLLSLLSTYPDHNFKCISFNELKVHSNKINTSQGAADDKEEKIIVISVFPCGNSDYSDCLTVKDLKEFLNKIEDKNEQICVHRKYKNGLFLSVINAYTAEDSASKTENAFYLWF